MLASSLAGRLSHGTMTRKKPDTPNPALNSIQRVDPRQERLATALRANLRRRKVQGRAQSEEMGVDVPANPETDSLS